MCSERAPTRGEASHESSSGVLLHRGTGEQRTAPLASTAVGLLDCEAEINCSVETERGRRAENSSTGNTGEQKKDAWLDCEVEINCDVEAACDGECRQLLNCY